VYPAILDAIASGDCFTPRDHPILPRRASPTFFLEASDLTRPMLLNFPAHDVEQNFGLPVG
jgi:hypothetical protein